MRRLLIGSPFATSQGVHERLGKAKALAVFSSDVLSSSAYATEEILLALAVGGTVALRYSLPIAAAIILLLAIVTLSYRQTIKAYPNGGGAYIVAHDNLGRGPGLIAAAALLVDYVLTVAVSVAAGVAAVTSAAPGLHELRVPMGVGVVLLITIGNLRGIRESGTLFALPTYFFLISMASMIAIGLVKVIVGDTPGSLFHAAPPQEDVSATQTLGLFLILKAFSSGCSALTGTEAISNGVPAFKPPESRNARTTLTAMAFTLGAIFFGVTYLTSRYGLVPSETETIVSKLGREVLGQNFLYYAYQTATALVLFLAANTSYADFPRLSAILANDRFMPKQFSFKGDRLAFTNGILLLTGTASLLLVVYGGEVSRLIPLYAIGVFVSFTLSQSGMIKHWWRLREPGWQSSMALNGIGAVATALVAFIIISVKFTHGAWISILLMAGLMLLFSVIRKHYDSFELALRNGDVHMQALDVSNRKDAPDDNQPHIVLPVDDLNKISTAAVATARSLSHHITALHVCDDRQKADQLRGHWTEAFPDLPLLVIESPWRAFVAPVISYLELLAGSEAEKDVIILMPTLVTRHWWERLLHNQDGRRLTRELKRQRRFRVVEVSYELIGRATT